MILFRDLTDLPDAFRGGAVAIGNFDGVHWGHARIVERLVAMARQIGGPAVAFTFEPHPAHVLRPEQAPAPLCWAERKAELLTELGADAVVAYPTTRAFLELGAREFFDRIVCQQLRARGMVEGQNFFFGHGRSGTTEVLRQFCAEAGVGLEVVAPVEVEGQVVSSSRVRSLVSEGQIDQANRLLTRPYRIRGTVVRGAGRGRTLGFPTANVGRGDTLLPGEGIYAGLAHLPFVVPPLAGGTERRPDETGIARQRAEARTTNDPRAEARTTNLSAAISIGPNPTFDERVLKVEAYLIDYQGDIYDHPIEVDFLARLRNIRRFASADELVAQMAKDVEATRRLGA